MVTKVDAHSVLITTSLNLLFAIWLAALKLSFPSNTNFYMLGPEKRLASSV